MNTFNMTLEADENGIVRIELPIGVPSGRYRVQIQVSPEPPGDDSPEIPDDSPDGFIEDTAGKWIGEFPDRDEDFREYYRKKSP